ncbi:MAG: CarD family transcriptional regulator [Deltaproteobacteria bacterium RIFOXYA12_FULL_58_15]|nr:MAG: CarD family transcriptional regulator [Deltaproteobacteria bacterium RIFOXYA12_FULL_58_15]OGR09864.1 MAG: CarD family transcriptional regulator [Deltaproteobacteria bacterium RIFOXYB12_FULL_58_9]
MDSSLKIGDKAVYPAHGVGEVTGIEMRNIAGFEQNFYVLRIIANEMMVLVPTNAIRQVGLREVINHEQVGKVFDVLKEKGMSVESGTWNRRHREYVEKLKTGSIFEVAKVFRDLCRIGDNKELSFGERKLLDTARSLLISELSCAEHCTAEEIDQTLTKMFPKQMPSAA